MNRVAHLAAVLATAALLVVSGTTSPPAAAASSSSLPNPMHPSFAVLDSAGVSVRTSGRPPAVGRTCGQCHDVGYINAHSDHWKGSVRADCAQCHFKGGALPTEPAAFDRDGKLLRDRIRISEPRDENCARCHGIIHEGADPLALPDDFAPTPRAWSGRSEEARANEAPAGDAPSTGGLKSYAFTLDTGSIFSSQDLSASFLNLQDRTEQNHPWDVHARRLVGCVDCHFASNNPTRAEVKRTRLDFLAHDPRRIPLSTYLRQPDHRLTAASCRSCHDPMAVHRFLPYKQRHLDVLACQACHASRPMGPAARTIDRTVMTESRTPAVIYRGMERPLRAEGAQGTLLNTSYTTGYSPLLLRGAGADGKARLAPYNAVDIWFWAAGPGGPEIPAERIRDAYFDGSSYAPSILAALDSDRDGTVEPTELVLDSAEKTESVRARLRALGVPNPVIERRVEFHPIQHGTQSGAPVQHDCQACHERDSRLGGKLALSSFVPAGADPTPAAPVDPSLDARIRISERAAPPEAWAEASGNPGLYVFGHSTRRWTDRLGFVLFTLVLAGVGIHAVVRYVLARRERKAPGSAHGPRPGAGVRATTRVYLYPAYERVWHWLMVASTLALMVTGLAVHFSGRWTWMPLPTAVAVHNFFAVILTANAFLALFYYVASAAIVQFLPPRDDFLGRIRAQARYYTRGIFLGHPHPSPKTQRRKLNPLQQVTYLALLNVLFPLQVATGILIWGVSRWPRVADAVGGLTVVAPVHNLGSWLFLSFVILHIYLTTTGHTVLSNINAMIDGYDEIELEQSLASGGSHV